MSWLQKWKDLPIIGKIGIGLAIIVPMGFLILGVITFIVKMTKKD